MRVPRRLTMIPTLTGKPTKEDYQRQRVYGMEKCILGWSVGTTTDLDVICAVRDHACREWRCDPPPLAKETRNRVYGSATDEEIRLNPDFDGQNMSVFLHELAHWISDKRCPDTEGCHHGPKFVGVYRYLLDRYNMLPRYAFDAMARRWEVNCQYVTPESV